MARCDVREVSRVLGDNDPALRGRDLQERVVGEVLSTQPRGRDSIMPPRFKVAHGQRRKHGVEHELHAKSRVRSTATRSASSRARSFAQTRKSISLRWAAA